MSAPDPRKVPLGTLLVRASLPHTWNRAAMRRQVLGCPLTLRIFSTERALLAFMRVRGGQRA